MPLHVHLLTNLLHHRPDSGQMELLQEITRHSSRFRSLSIAGDCEPFALLSSTDAMQPSSLLRFILVYVANSNTYRFQEGGRSLSWINRAPKIMDIAFANLYWFTRDPGLIEKLSSLPVVRLSDTSSSDFETVTIIARHRHLLESARVFMLYHQDDLRTPSVHLPRLEALEITVTASDFPASDDPLPHFLDAVSAPSGIVHEIFQAQQSCPTQHWRGLVSISPAYKVLYSLPMEAASFHPVFRLELSRSRGKTFVQPCSLQSVSSWKCLLEPN